MPSSDTTQALVAAFAFGIIVNAATASLFLFTKDHGWLSLRDGPRLVLIVFLAGAALWAQTDFIAITIDGNAMPGCQVATTFTSAFDQIARVALIQFLLWGIQNGNKTTAHTYVFQGLVLFRFVLGAVIVGMIRPQFTSQYCVATTLIMPLNLSGVVFDCVIAFFLLVRVFIQGSFKSVTEGNHSVVRRKVLVLGIIAFAIWSAMSAPMLLGYASMTLVTRTLLPAIGLGIVLAVLVFNYPHLSLAPQRAASEEQGGGFTGGVHSREPTSQDSGYSTDTYAPPNRYEGIKGETVVRIDAFAQHSRSNRGFGHTKAPSIGQIGRPHLQQGPAGVGFDAQATFAPSRQAPAPNQVQRTRTLPKKSGKVQISAPVLVANAETGKNPLDRIATIDLATAARNEKERREMPPQPLASNLLPGSQGSRAPLSPNSMMKNHSASVKRKEIARGTTERSITTEPLLNPDDMVTTTSSQLSPGIEELRRRSPRHAPQGPLSSHGVTSSPQIPAKSARRSQLALSALTASDSKTRPSSTLPITPPPKSPKRAQPPLSPFGRVASPNVQTPPVPNQPGLVKVFIKTAGPLQNSRSPLVPPKDTTVPATRLMNGLPKNPRMTAMKPSVPQQKVPEEQTVMLLKNIEYDDPSTVRDIMNSTTENSKGRTPSVVHRPRPIPRQSVVDRQIFPAEGSPSPKSRHAHKRSLSGGSRISHKSILQSVPTSPSKLPPLPPVPQTAGQPGRPLPNNTRSMTFNEKMEIFYASESNNDQPAREMRRRSSSVPELPELPAAFKERSRSRSRSREPLRDSAHQTDKSSRSSIRTASLLNFPEVPMQRTVAPVSKFSVDTTVGEGLMWATATKAKFDGIKRQSSPVIPIQSFRSPSNASEMKSHDDDVTLWGSIHSPVKCTIMQKASAIEVPPVPKISDCPALEAKTREDSLKREPNTATDRDSHVIMTVVLDTSDHLSPAVKQAAPSDLDRVMEVDSRPASWHRRIGDDCPMFSGRQDSVKRRKNPPPAPLPLNRTFDRRPRLIPPTDPSPLEAPEQALLAIQEQLRKFEDPNRESTGSQQLQRMTLLANLEAEMGVHENQWQKMHSRLDRDSFSTTTGSPRKGESRPESLAVSVVAQADNHSQKLERRSSRPSIRLSKNKHTASIASIRSSNSVENEHEWDEDLATAQAEYLKHRYQLVSHLSKRTSEMPVCSPSQITKIEQPAGRLSLDKGEPKATLASGTTTSQKLWQSSSLPTHALIESTPSLWTGTASSINATFSTTPQVNALRRTSTRVFEPLTVQSNRLWEKKQKRGSFAPQKGLWVSKFATRPISNMLNSAIQPQQASVTKTLARKPSRRSKRITLLPDILENPEPMPDKRGTLALYQFPWGEKSDTASIRPRPQMFMAMPGTMTSGRSMQQREQQQQQQPVPILTNPFSFDADNYSASYFDDEDEGDNFPEAQALSDEEDGSNYEEDDSDDFDETTLWEIASLLKSNLVPSRESLLPDDLRYTVDPAPRDYSQPVSASPDATMQSDYEQDNLSELRGEVQALHTEGSPLEATQAALWTSQQTSSPVTNVKTLPAPNEETWQDYEAALHPAVRAPTRSVEPTTLLTNSLWTAGSELAAAGHEALLWQPKAVPRLANGLWAQQPQTNQAIQGLSDPSRELWASYQVDMMNIIRRPTRVSEPTQIESTSLWKPVDSALVSTPLWNPQPQMSKQPKGAANPSRKSWAFHCTEMTDIIRAPTRPSETSTIESTSLWKLTSAGEETCSTGLWTSEATTREPLTHLWPHSSTTKVQPLAYLEQPLTPEWTKYTTSALSPVRAKPRLETLAETAPELASKALWGTAHASSPVREDWISLSTVRARSPSTSSVESVASEASSMKSTTTKASTVGSIFSAFWRRKRGVSDAKTEDSMPEVPEVPEVPILPVVPEVNSATANPGSTKGTPTKAPAILPLRRQHRRNIAFRVDWDAALEEALLASKISVRKIVRPTAAPADWAAALSAAIPQPTLAPETTFSKSPLPVSQLWTSPPLKSPLPTITSLWSSQLTSAPRTAFPAGCSVLPDPTRRGRSGSLLAQDNSSEAAMQLAVPEGLTEQSLWRRSVAMEKAEVRTRNWLAAGSN